MPQSGGDVPYLHHFTSQLCLCSHRSLWDWDVLSWEVCRLTRVCPGNKENCCPIPAEFCKYWQEKGSHMYVPKIEKADFYKPSLKQIWRPKRISCLQTFFCTLCAQSGRFFLLQIVFFFQVWSLWGLLLPHQTSWEDGWHRDLSYIGCVQGEIK